LQCGQAPPQRRRKHYGGRIDGAGERGAIESSAGSVRGINLVACRRLIAAAALAANAIDDRTAAGELRYWPTLSRGQIDSRAVAASNCHLIARPVPMTARWGWQRFSPAYDNPDPRKRRSSGIRRKIDSQRQAECKVERNAGCECNGGRIHFPVPHFSHALLSGLPDYAAHGTWAVKMVPLSLERGRLGI
jgi:hypothetical protein